MKTTLLFIVLFFVGVNNAQIIHFPDAEFKAQLLLSSNQYEIARDSQGNLIAIDSNGNQEIEVSEALGVYDLQINPYLEERTISDVTGLVFFSNLRSLSILHTEIQTFDVRPFQHLIHLICLQNERLNTINVSGLTQLETLWVSACNLTALDVSGLVNLKDLNFALNNITTVNLDGCENIEIFGCSYNNLQQLDFTGFHKLQLLQCDNNRLTTLDVSGNPDMKILDCSMNDALASIYMKNTTFTGVDLEENFHFIECPNLEYICTDTEAIDYISQLVIANGYNNCVVDDSCMLATNNFTQPQFTVFPNPATNLLNIVSNATIQSAQIYNMLGQQVFSVVKNDISSLDISSLRAGSYVVKINSIRGISNVKFIKTNF